MRLSDGIQEAYQRKWSMINTFTVQIILSTFLSNKVGNFGDDLNLNIINVTTPDFSNEPIEIFTANRWIIQNGKDTLYRFSITFRDEGQMSLYRKFMKIYSDTRENYFDDIASTIIIYKDADYVNEQDIKFMTFNGVIIEGISNLAFSNVIDSEIAEFTVNFKCNNPNIL